MENNQFKEARIITGLSRPDVERLLGIPVRTLENWESGVGQPGDYVKKMYLKELKNMDNVKYLVVDEKKAESFDVFTEVFDNLEDANKDAESQWDMLTAREKKQRHIFVLDVKRRDLEEDAVDDEGNIDWCAYNAGGYCDGRFDSEEIEEIEEIEG